MAVLDLTVCVAHQKSADSGQQGEDSGDSSALLVHLYENHCKEENENDSLERQLNGTEDQQNSNM